MGFERPVPSSVEVVITTGVMGGVPCISGTRVPAETVLRYLSAGEGKREIYADYPYLPAGAVEAVAAWARSQGLDAEVPD